MSVLDTARARVSELDIKALIVDDDEFMHDVVRVALANIGLNHIHAVDNGADALDFVDDLEDCSSTIIFLDLNMPDMDGVELIRHLSTRGFNGNVVPLSGEDRQILKSVEDLARQRKLRVLAALQKPVSIDDLAMAIAGISLSRRAVTSAQIEENSVTAAEVAEALQNNEIFAVFQPKIDIATCKVLGVEALARWQRPNGDIIRPDWFIPVAEAGGLINQLTEYMFVYALRSMAEWRRHDIDLAVSVNVSVQTLNQMDVSQFDLPSFIVSRAGEAGISADRLIIEVTESRLMEDLAGPLDVMARLRLKGVKLSIDDFGTGYSTMKQLVRVPAQEMKIDKSFVSGAGADKVKYAILKSSIQLGKSLDMKTVAEGVETREEWKMVEELGADIVQGYYAARPLKADEFVTWHEKWVASH